MAVFSLGATLCNSQHRERVKKGKNAKTGGTIRTLNLLQKNAVLHTDSEKFTDRFSHDRSFQYRRLFTLK